MAEATGFSFLELLADKNFQNLLAGVGTQLGGPGSVGAALGTGTLAYNKALASQAAAKTTLANRTAATTTEPLAPATTAPTTASKLSYAVKDPTVLADEVADLLTAPNEPGPTSVARDKSGAINVKYTPPARPAPSVGDLLGTGQTQAQDDLQAEIDGVLDPYLPRRRSVQQATLAVAPTPAGVITPQMRANDRSIILTPKSSEEDYLAAVNQGARRRNLEETKAQELIDAGPVRKAAREQRTTDRARFDTDPNYRVQTTLDYLDTLAMSNPGLRPARSVQTTVPQSTPGVEVAATPNEIEALVAPSSAQRPSDMTINIEKQSQPRPTGVAEAATPPAVQTQAEQLADILGLPITEVSPKSAPVKGQVDLGTADVDKRSPQLTPLAPKVVRESYDLRGLSPDEVDKVVGRALEAERNDIARSVDKRENNQLIETDEGYLVLNKRTREITPLTREGKLDTRKQLEINRHKTLSPFSQEMSTVPGTDYVVRPKMTDSQSKAFEYGSMALQANERQRRLELRQSKLGPNGPEQFATRRASILSTLESLPPDMPMNIVGTILGATGAIADVLLNLPANVKAGWERLVSGQAEWSDLGEPVRKALEAAGLGPAAARVYASIGLRGDLNDDEKEFLANSLEFSTAMLRRQSGAAISAGEFLQTYRQYFPIVGDKATDVHRKNRTRQQAIRGLRSSAGRPLLVPNIYDDEED